MTRTEVETFVRNYPVAAAWLNGEALEVAATLRSPTAWEHYDGKEPSFENPLWSWRIKPKESDLQVLKRQLEAAIELQESGGMIAMTADERNRHVAEFGLSAIVVGDYVITRRRP